MLLWTKNQADFWSSYLTKALSDCRIPWSAINVLWKYPTFLHIFPQEKIFPAQSKTFQSGMYPRRNKLASNFLPLKNTMFKIKVTPENLWLNYELIPSKNGRFFAIFSGGGGGDTVQDIMHGTSASGEASHSNRPCYANVQCRFRNVLFLTYLNAGLLA